jgi:hypothetical protein
MKMKLVMGAAALFSSALLQAQNIEVKITNLTHGITYTPLLVAAHGADDGLFTVSELASASLQAMAEGGDISGLMVDLDNTGGAYVANPASGLLAPAASTTANLDTGSNGYLSIVAMLLPTNDGFVGLDSWEIPKKKGTYTVYLNAYDAGTEVNNEIINGAGAPGALGVPAAPNGDGGTGATGVASSEFNTNVHIHRGNVGDTDPNGGNSDVDSRVHRWLNPVAKVTVTVGN